MIIVNLDIMMARRKISLGELAENFIYPLAARAAQFIYFENGKGKSYPFLYTGGYLQSVGLSAGRYFGISGRRRIER